MTEEDKDSIPPLESSDQEEAEEMAEEDFCSCTGTKTKANIKKNNNKCPDPNCGKKMTDIPGYDSDESAGEPSRNEHQFKIFADWLEGLSIGQVKTGRPGKGNTSDQNQNPVRIKPPSFEGRNDPAHFFVKLQNFVEINKIKKEAEKIAVLKSCLSGEALDLFLSLSAQEQKDLNALEKIFKQYFKPVKHDIIETERFLKTKKDKEQPVLNFYLKIKKKGLELLMDPALIKQAFCQGLDRETQKHCALKKAGTVEECLEAALE